ncbi:MAG: hypothetical protein ACR2IV_02785 [Bryobacteraceae bacterium]
MPDPEEQHSPRAGDNRLIVDALRKSFAVIAKRLTTEVEPATIYLPYMPGSDPGSRVEKPE